jgi:hypothetical protein
MGWTKIRFRREFLRHSDLLRVGPPKSLDTLVKTNFSLFRARAATTEAMRWIIESMRWTIESMRWIIESMRWVVESMRWIIESMRNELSAGGGIGGSAFHRHALLQTNHPFARRPASSVISGGVSTAWITTHMPQQIRRLKVIHWLN